MLDFIAVLISFFFPIILLYLGMGLAIINATIGEPKDFSEKSSTRFFIIWIFWLPIIIIREGVLWALEKHDRNSGF